MEALAGAEFVVYVYSSEGKLTPWANPLLPSEPMRIRTGETETRFSLPQGTEFYLRQERAPEGYTFDSQTLIPVTDGEIVVQNKAQGRLNITVRDQRGEAIEGVRLTATDETGAQTELTTDGNGQAVLLCDREGNYTVSETELPEGVLPAQNDSASAQVALASAVSVVFEHPAPGTVQAAATVVSVNALGEREEKPLAGLTLHIAGQGDVTTDSDGMAQAALPEGSYDVTLSYAGDADPSALHAGAVDRARRTDHEGRAGGGEQHGAHCDAGRERACGIRRRGQLRLRGDGRGLRPVCDGRGRAGGFRPASGGRLPRGENHRTEKHSSAKRITRRSALKRDRPRRFRCACSRSKINALRWCARRSTIWARGRKRR